MPGAHDLLRRGRPATSDRGVCDALSRREKSSGPRQSADQCRRSVEPRGSHSVPPASRWLAEVLLPAGSMMAANDWEFGLPTSASVARRGRTMFTTDLI